MENLTEQFCQKVELIQSFLSQAHDQPMWSSFFLQGTKACKDREVPTLQQKREREKSKAGGKADSGEKVTYRREWTSGSGKPEL